MFHGLWCFEVWLHHIDEPNFGPLVIQFEVFNRALQGVKAKRLHSPLADHAGRDGEGDSVVVDDENFFADKFSTEILRLN